MVQAMTKLVNSPPENFREQISTHFSERGEKMYKRIKFWMDLSKTATPSTEVKEPSVEEGELFWLCHCFCNQLFPSVDATNTSKPPDFPLVPASRGFCLTLAGLLENFLAKIKTIDSKETATAAKTPKTECDSAI